MNKIVHAINIWEYLNKSTKMTSQADVAKALFIEIRSVRVVCKALGDNKMIKRYKIGQNWFVER